MEEWKRQRIVESAGSPVDIAECGVLFSFLVVLFYFILE